MLRVKFKKLHPEAVIPSHAKEGDAGMDLTAIKINLSSHTQVEYSTGLSVEIPEGYVGLIFPRSSICKYDLALSNSVGVIDSGYRGEIRFVFNKLGGLFSPKYKTGERVGQLVIIPYAHIMPIESEELSESQRGIGGFGSTGK